jgi:hypothetical protein
MRPILINNPNSNLLIGSKGKWKFDEGVGSIVRDSSGNGLDLYLSGSAIWNKGIYGNSVFFVEAMAASQQKFIIPSSGFSMSCWCKPTTSSQTGIIFAAWVTPANFAYIQLINFSGSVQLRVGKISGDWLTLSTNGSVLPNNIWTHFAFTWNGQLNSNSMVLYVNGKVPTQTFAPDASTPNPAGTLVSLSFANEISAGNPSFVGGFDQGQVWNRALSSAEIYQLYALQPGNGQ